MPLHPIPLYLCKAVFYCRSSILSKTQPLFRRGGHFPSRFFVNTQSRRCDILCVTFTNSGACPCTQSALLYVKRFFIAAHQFYLKPNHCFSVADISSHGILLPYNYTEKKRVMPISAIHVFISMPTFSISLFE